MQHLWSNIFCFADATYTQNYSCSIRRALLSKLRKMLPWPTAMVISYERFERTLDQYPNISKTVLTCGISSLSAVSHVARSTCLHRIRELWNTSCRPICRRSSSRSWPLATLICTRIDGKVVVGERGTRVGSEKGPVEPVIFPPP